MADDLSLAVLVRRSRSNWRVALLGGAAGGLAVVAGALVAQQTGSHLLRILAIVAVIAAVMSLGSLRARHRRADAAPARADPTKEHA